MNTYIAEFIGTFALATLVALSVSGTFGIATPLLAALTLGLFVYTIGHVSGAHINPAVTAGLWSINKITLSKAINYIIVQIAAGALAYILVRMVHPTFPTVGAVTPLHGIGELVGTFFFTFGIAAVVSGKVPSMFSGIVVGGSLFIGISFAALIGSAGVLNPAVALALGTLNPIYALAPILGSILGFQVYKMMA